MNIRQMQSFLKVAQTGSFTAAAEELFISQSSLSKQIIALEKELGILLIDRSNRRIALTRAGEVFEKHARNLNAAYLAMLADLGEYKTSPSFSILAIPVIAQYDIPSHLAQFRHAYPHFDYTLTEREASLILPALDDHQYDLAFVRDIQFDTKIYASLVIAQDRLLVAVSESHRLADRASVALHELAMESFVLPAEGTLVHELAVNACRQAGFEPRIVYASLRAETILGLVAANSGIALMMEGVFEYSRHVGVIGVPLVETIEGNVALAWLRNKKLSAATRTFIEFMGKQLGMERLPAD